MKKAKGKTGNKDGRQDDDAPVVPTEKTQDLDTIIKSNLEGVLASDEFIDRLWSKLTDKLETLMTGVQQKFIDELKLNELKQENSDLKRENEDLKQRLRDVENTKVSHQVEIQQTPSKTKDSPAGDTSTSLILEPGKSLALEFRRSDDCKCNNKPPGIVLKFAPKSRHRSSEKRRSRKNVCTEMCLPGTSTGQTKDCPVHRNQGV